MLHRSISSLGSVLLFVILVSAACDGTSPDDPLSNVSGAWDARFEGTIDGIGFSQNDVFTMELVQSGSSVSGTLRVVGLDVDFPLSGTVTGNRFEYGSTFALTDCQFRIEAVTEVDSDGRRFTGNQTQSSCEGTARGRVEGNRLRALEVLLGRGVDVPARELLRDRLAREDGSEISAGRCGIRTADTSSIRDANNLC